MSSLLRMGSATAIILFVSIWSSVVGQTPYRVNDQQAEQTLTQLEHQSNRFRSSLDHALDKSRLNGTSTEDEINRSVKDYYEATKHLRNRFKDHKSTSTDVEEVLNRAARIDLFMRRHDLASQARNDWRLVRSDLDELARIYNVSWGWDEGAIGSPVSSIPYRVSDKDVEKLMERIEQQSDRFRSALDHDLDKSRLDGTKQEDEINAYIKDYYRDTKTLRDHFKDHKSTSEEVQTVLARASRIDDFMRRHRLRGSSTAEWDRLRGDLNELASVYNVDWRWSY